MENSESSEKQTKLILDLYDQMHDMEVLLDDDPLAYGPKRLNNKIAELRNMLTGLERIFNKTSKIMGVLKNTLLQVKTEITLKKNYLLVHDPEVRSGRSVSDRESHAYVKMADLVKKKLYLEKDLREVEDLMVVIKAKRSDLRDTQSRLRDQIKLCQDEIALGNRWGDAKPKKKKRDATSELNSALADLEKEFNGSEGSNWEIDPKKKVEKPSLPNINDSKKTDDFLDSLLEDELDKDLEEVADDEDISFDEIFSEEEEKA